MVPEIHFLKKTRHDTYTDSGWHSHLTLQMSYVLAGKLVVHFHGLSRPILPGDLLFVVNGHLHRIEGFPGCRQYLVQVSLTPSPAHFSVSASSVAKFEQMNRHSMIIPESPKIGSWLEEMESYWRGDDPTRQMVSQGLLLRLFTHLETLEGIIIKRKEFNNVPFSEYKTFYQVIETVERLYRNKRVRVSDIAKANFISQSYLYKLFKKHIGCGPKRYLQQHRIDRAVELLQLGRRSISTIAQDTGFPDVYSFSRAFKRLTGHPPSSYLHVGPGWLER